MLFKRKKNLGMLKSEFVKMCRNKFICKQKKNRKKQLEKRGGLHEEEIEKMMHEAFMEGYKYAIQVLQDGIIKKTK